ncbi:pentatricopeptide repeat-containing protein 1, mitochondrial [Ptiloglossa arizonensis]|uniref:pentatricopeptide repeat-containing protein 1, mitochondrial n=1 Tax=Ptiloglossa arizonensis TaxID=3350558 RepID=UPI003F9EE470
MNFSLKSKTCKGYINKYIYCIKQEKQCISKLYSYSNDTSIKTSYLCSLPYNNKIKFNKNGPLSMQIKDLFNWPNLHRKLCTNIVTKPANVFGDISYEKYDRIKMDDKELEEEIYMEKYAKPPKWQERSSGEYVNLIKSYLHNKDLNQALSVLDLVKKDRHKPNLYMFQILIRAFAVQGNIKVCFKLYNKLKKYGFTVNDAVYNSLINACAESKDKTLALRYLHYLRINFYRTNYILNEVHYITFIKAYNWHKEISIAFEIADEARDKGICTPGLYAALFHASLSDKKCGLRYALVLWHQMKKNKIKPNVTHYNLLLGAIKDTKLGESNTDNLLKSELIGAEIQFNEVGESDLLNSPPLLSTVFPKINRNDLFQNEFSTIKKHNINSEIIVIDKTELSVQYLNNVLAENRLFLFGGLSQLLKRMESDNVIPNIKTLSLIVLLIPSSIKIEEYFLNYVYKKKFKLDTDFFNMIIKKRNMRGRFKEARAVLNEIQRNNLSPNILTFGVLALGCDQFHHGRELLEQMNNINFEPNKIILGTLLQKACFHKDFKYASFLIEYMSRNNIKPSEYILKTLTNFEKLILTFLRSKTVYKENEIRKVSYEFNNFKMLCKKCKIMETLSNQHSYK